MDRYADCKPVDGGSIPPSCSTTNLFNGEFIMTDLKIAIEKVDSEAIHGVNCPCCGTYVKEWKKPIVSTAAGSLVNLVAFYKDEPKFYHLDA